MIKQIRILQSWFLAVLLATGFGLGWFFLVYIGSDLSISRGWSTVLVRGDGTPLVQSWSGKSYGQDTFETLDGKSVEKPEVLIRSVSFNFPNQDPSSVAWHPLSWKQRLARFMDERAKDGILWYLIHDGKINGAAHFVGYDRKSKLCVGYLGQRGFQKSKPTLAESFPIFGSVGLDGKILSSECYVYHDLQSFTNRISMDMPAYLVYLLSGDQLLEVNLRKRSVRVLREIEGMWSIQGFNLSWLTDDSLEKKAFGGSVVLVQTKKAIHVLDTKGQDVGCIVFPESLRARRFELYPLGKKKFLAERYDYLIHESSNRCHLIWFDDQGVVEKEKSVEWPVQPSVKKIIWTEATALPIPVLTPIASLYAAADGYTKSGEYDDYPSALAAVLSDAWPAIGFVNLLGVILAVICYRRQRRYDQRWTWVWVITVFLFGLPGFVGYLAHRRWPPIEPCPNCDAAAPRDRAECCACGKEFPRPKRKGTEVFA